MPTSNRSGASLTDLLRNDPAMMKALQELGYDAVYHMKSVPMRKDVDYWVAALEAKYEDKGPKWGREEWDHLLGDCMVSPMPWPYLSLHDTNSNRP